MMNTNNNQMNSNNNNNINQNAFTQLTLLPVNGSINMNTTQSQSRSSSNITNSSTLQIQSVISKQVENVQKILKVYNNPFIQSIQSLTEKLASNINNINNNTHQQVINDIQTLINIQDTMWKDLSQQKSATDVELDKIKRQLMTSLAVKQRQAQQAQAQQVIFINNVMQTQYPQPMIYVVGNNNNISHPQMTQLAVNDINGNININGHPLITNNVQTVDTRSDLSNLLNIMPNINNSNIINNSSSFNGVTSSNQRSFNMHANTINNISNVNNPFIVNNNSNDNRTSNCINSNPAGNVNVNVTNDIDRELAEILATHSLPSNINNINTMNNHNLNNFHNNNSINNLNANDEKLNIPNLNVDNHQISNININGNNNNNRSNRKKRKRRGYNGPYSEEEKKFMREFNRNKTTEDIMALSIEMENKFKVKRSPYGLAQKMYQMGIINSRLKAIFQRQFQNENNTNPCDEEKDNDSNNINNNSNNNSTNVNNNRGNVLYNNAYHPSNIESKENINPKAASPSNTAYSSNSSSSQSSNNGHSIAIKRRPFTSAELNYLNELINNYNNEQPRKLFWRFVQKFKNWNDTQKSYQKFYHKYWTLTNEKRTNKKTLKQEVDDDDITIINNNDNSNRTSSKRQISLSAFNESTPKRIKPN